VSWRGLTCSVVACKPIRALVASTEPLPSNEFVYIAVLKQRPSLLASQFQLSANVTIVLILLFKVSTDKIVVIIKRT
jgi:hypothetical protein